MTVAERARMLAGRVGRGDPPADRGGRDGDRRRLHPRGPGGHRRHGHRAGLARPRTAPGRRAGVHRGLGDRPPDDDARTLPVRPEHDAAAAERRPADRHPRPAPAARGGRPYTAVDRLLASQFASQAALALVLADAQHYREQLAVYEDRDRIARDLHDLVVQRLFATEMMLESTRRKDAVGRRRDRRGAWRRPGSTNWTPRSRRSGPRSSRCSSRRPMPPPRSAAGCCARRAARRRCSASSRRCTSPGRWTPWCRSRSTGSCSVCCAGRSPPPPPDGGVGHRGGGGRDGTSARRARGGASGGRRRRAHGERHPVADRHLAGAALSATRVLEWATPASRFSRRSRASREPGSAAVARTR